MKYGRLRASPPVDALLLRTWRPWPLRLSFFVGFIALCILLCIGIELVILGCAADGCHIFGGPFHIDPSLRTYFIYNQLPTVLSLILNLLWAVPHHDVMRLEPYFRMSMPGGASAADSIFLKYPYTFPLFVPYKAVKRRHFVVLTSSCIGLLMSFLVTPLISGIFDDTMLLRTVADTGTRATFHPFNENSTLSGAFTYVAYHVGWLSGSFPKFTTPTFALLPVNSHPRLVGKETWTAETILFEAKLVCEKAASINIQSTESDGITVKIVSQGGAYTVTLCDQKKKNFALLQHIAEVNAAHAASVAPPPRNNPLTNPFGPTRNTMQTTNPNSLANNRLGRPIRRSAPRPTTIPPRQVGSAADNETCDGFTTFITPWTAIAQRVLGAQTGGNASEVYLYGWASGVNPPWPTIDSAPRPTNITALFCRTNYYSQRVAANFSMPDGIVEGVNRVGTRNTFVNLRNFDQIINGEMAALSTPVLAKNAVGDLFGLGYQPAQVPNADSQLQRKLGVRPKNVTKLFVTVEEGLIDASSHSSVYIDNVNGLPGLALADRTLDNLGELLDPKKLAAAYERALQTMFALAVAVEMVQPDEDSPEAVAVVRRLLTKGYVVNNLWARGSQGGLAVVVVAAALLAVSISRRSCKLDGEPNSLAEALRLLAASPDVSVEMENSEFHDPKALLRVFKEGGGKYTLDLVPEQGSRVRASNVRKHPKLPANIDGKRRPWRKQLWALRGISGIGFLTFFGVVGVLLSIAFAYSRSHGGLPTLAPVNSFWYKALFTYIPMAVGMTAEPTLTTIASYQCMLAPYTVLTPGPAGSSTSLAVDYDKSPPHFQLIRALRTNNIPLAALTISIFLCNVLAVALAGLFSGTTRPLNMTTEVDTHEVPRLYAGFTKPAQEMYFILAEQLAKITPPLAWTTPGYYVLPVLPVDSTDVKQYQTPSLGIGIDIKCNLLPAQNITMACDMRGCAASNEPYDYSDYSMVVADPCWGHTVASAATGTELFTTNYTWEGLSHDNLVHSTNCPDTFFAIWAERPWDPQPPNGERYQTHLDSLVLKCTTAETVVELNVLVSKERQVVSSTVVRTLAAEEVTALYPRNGTGPTNIQSPVNTTGVANSSNPVNIESRLAATFIDVIRAGIRTENSPDSHKIRWLNNLMKTIDPRIDRNLRNMTHIPDPAYIAGALEEAYRRLFAINLQLYQATMIGTGELHKHPAAAVVQIDRVGVSSLMFILAASIILTIMTVLTFLYLRRRQPVGNVPETLAGMYALLYASNAKEECGKLYGKDPKERAKNLEEFEGQYVYGSFQDGEHYGVYRRGELAGLDTAEMEGKWKSVEK